MITFDDLTLLEVEEIEAEFGKGLDELSGIRAAGAVLWMERRRTNPLLTYAEFRPTVTMRDINQWMSQANAADADPLDGSGNGSPKNAHGSNGSGTSALASIAS